MAQGNSYFSLKLIRYVGWSTVKNEDHQFDQREFIEEIVAESIQWII